MTLSREEAIVEARKKNDPWMLRTIIMADPHLGFVGPDGKRPNAFWVAKKLGDPDFPKILIKLLGESDATKAIEDIAKSFGMRMARKITPAVLMGGIPSLQGAAAEKMNKSRMACVGRLALLFDVMSPEKAREAALKGLVEGWLAGGGGKLRGMDIPKELVDIALALNQKTVFDKGCVSIETKSKPVKRI